MTTRDQALKELTALGMKMNADACAQLPDNVLEMVLRAARKVATVDLQQAHANLEKLHLVHIEMATRRGLSQCPLCNAVLVLEA